jgi:uncharacterized protein YjbJ (UPF0337 family)
MAAERSLLSVADVPTTGALHPASGAGDYSLVHERSSNMGELIDKAKGKVKEVTGAATGDRRLEGEGKIDRAKGAVKGAAEEVKQAVKDATRKKEEKP